MRRVLCQALLAIVLLAGGTAALPAAESGSHEAETGHAEPSIWWKWFNFSILAGGLAYLAISKGGPYFKRRGEEIYRLVRAAEQVQAEAQAEAAEIDRRLAGLDADTAAIRAKALHEFEAERDRTQAETVAAGEKLRENAESEIAALTKQARRELRALASERALALARQKVQARINPETEARLFASFVSGLKSMGSQAGGPR